MWSSTELHFDDYAAAVSAGSQVEHENPAASCHVVPRGSGFGLIIKAWDDDTPAAGEMADEGSIGG